MMGLKQIISKNLYRKATAPIFVLTIFLMTITLIYPLRIQGGEIYTGANNNGIKMASNIPISEKHENKAQKTERRTLKNKATQKQDKKGMVKESFQKTVQEEFKSLQAWGQRRKNNPEKCERDNSWNAFYDEYYDFEYDIQKTNSRVTPYIGIVTFKGKSFTKRGTSKEECLNAEWKWLDVNSKPTLQYSYQHGKWVLKKKPPFYKEY
jgi:hypothetical protein